MKTWIIITNQSYSEICTFCEFAISCTLPNNVKHKPNGDVAQIVERLLSMQEVQGSIACFSILYHYKQYVLEAKLFKHPNSIDVNPLGIHLTLKNRGTQVMSLRI